MSIDRKNKMSDIFYAGRAGKKGNGLFAKVDIKKGTPIIRITGTILPKKDVTRPVYVLQLDDDLFIQADEGAMDDNLNHSCNPTCRIDRESLQAIAIRDIKAGEEITFNYNTTEYDMVANGDAFKCHCGSEECIGEVQGFKHLPMEKKKKIRDILLPYLKRKLLEEEIKARN